MIVKYYAASIPKVVIEKDLSTEKIIEWTISDRLGYKPKGSLIIDFANRGGIYPPVKDILNFKEVLNYLETNFRHCKV